MCDWDDVERAVTILFFGILIGWLGGWLHAHYTVAEECERLGSFYVGERTFTCTKIEPK